MKDKKIVDRHFSTGGKWNWGSNRKTEGTKLREVPQRNAPRNYFDDSNSYVAFSTGNLQNNGEENVVYRDSVDWYRPQREGSSFSNNSNKIGGVYTGDVSINVGSYSSPTSNMRWINYDQPTAQQPGPNQQQQQQQPITTPFACELLDSSGDSPKEITARELGSAAKCFDQMTFKLFNNSVVPGNIIQGIVYFDVVEDVKINKITLNGQSILKKDISGRDQRNVESIVYSFQKVIVSSSNDKNRRSPSQYTPLTDDWNGSDLMQRLQLSEDAFQEPNMEWPFAGPITLLKGSHAIPFSARVPFETNPTVDYERKGENRQKANVNLSTNVSVQVEAQPASGGALMSFSSDKLPLQIISCGGLPLVVNGQYSPGFVQSVKLEAKDASAIIILEKKYLVPGDTIRIFVYTDNKDVVSSAFAELITSSNLVDIGLADLNDLIADQKTIGLEIIQQSSKKRLDRKFNKVFVSRVGDAYPANITNNAPNGRLPSNMDDKSLMAETNRQAGCLIELKLPKEATCSIEAGDCRIRYHLRVHLSVRGQRKPVSQALLIIVAEQLKPNYSVKYIKLVN